MPKHEDHARPSGPLWLTVIIGITVVSAALWVGVAHWLGIAIAVAALCAVVVHIQLRPRIDRAYARGAALFYDCQYDQAIAYFQTRTRSSRSRRSPSQE